MTMTKTLAVAVAAAVFMAGAAFAAPKHKAGDDASQEPGAISYCADRQAQVKLATWTGPNEVSVQCYIPAEVVEGYAYEKPADAKDYVNLGNNSTGNMGQWSVGGLLMAAVALTLLGNGDNTNGTTP
jgi:hypothetical protein